jgi:hypothetical protein
MASQQSEAIDQILNILNLELSPAEWVKRTGFSLGEVVPFDRFSMGLSQLRVWFFLQNGEVTL